MYHSFPRADEWKVLFPEEQTPVHAVRFHGNLEHSSPFKGPPSKAVDAAWDRIAPRKSQSVCMQDMLTIYRAVAVIDIPEDVYAGLNASKHAVRTPPEVGSGYMGVLEGIHLVHCVVSSGSLMART
jgi:hypothetical protein